MTRRIDFIAIAPTVVLVLAILLTIGMYMGWIPIYTIDGRVN